MTRSDCLHSTAVCAVQDMDGPLVPRRDRVAEFLTAQSTTAPPTPGSADLELLALFPKWEEAAALYTRRIEGLGKVEGSSAAREIVQGAEKAARTAGDALHAIEVQIGKLPALTMAGLRLKARVAQRSDSFEIVWPDGFGEGLVQDILALSEPEIASDLDLIRLGRLFEAARAKEVAACEAYNVAHREAHCHMPERPAALLYRACDHAMYLHKHYTSPEHLDGREITSEDIAWVSRKRHTRDVRRPVRPEDKLPSGAQFVVGSEPWPEAQTRADEIVAAWDAWVAEKNTVYARHVTPAIDKAATDASDAAIALAERLAGIPARTAEGFRVKLRVLAHFRRDVLSSELGDQPDPDQILLHSLWRDMQGEAKAVDPAGDPLIPAILDGWAAWGLAGVTAGTEDEDTAAWEQAVAQRDRLLHAAMAQPANADTIAAKALACAWMEWVCVERPGTPREAYGGADQLVYDIHSVIMGREVAAATTHVSSLLRTAGIDLKAISLDDLAALHSAANLITDVAAAITCQPKSMTGDRFNASGRMVDHIHDNLCDAIAATEAEIRSRKPSKHVENQARLAALATSTIHNDDCDEIIAFAREMLAFAESNRVGSN